MPDLTGELASTTDLFRTFLVGIVLGVIAAAGALYAFPVIQQEREVSIMSVAPNGGTLESFHISVPTDRVMVGTQARNRAVPPGLEWPADSQFSNLRTELFKIRNADDTVVGVGVRTAARRDNQDIVDWLLHLPARGSLFVSMEAAPRDGGARVGAIVSGTREFARLSGSLGEFWVANEAGAGDMPLGRIELRASYIGEPEPVEASESAE